MEKVYAVYLLASKPYGTLYIGVTGDLISRIAQHKAREIPGFTRRYKIHTLVRFENFGEVDAAISGKRP